MSDLYIKKGGVNPKVIFTLVDNNDGSLVDDVANGLSYITSMSWARVTGSTLSWSSVVLTGSLGVVGSVEIVAPPGVTNSGMVSIRVPTALAAVDGSVLIQLGLTGSDYSIFDGANEIIEMVVRSTPDYTLLDSASQILVTPANKINTDVSGNVALDSTILASAVLATPANKLTTDVTGRVVASNPAPVTDASISSAVATQLLVTPANKLLTDGAGNVTSTNPAPVTDTSVSDAVAAKLLITPANKLNTDVTGRVTTSNPASGSAVTDASVSDAVAAKLLVTPTNKLTTNASGQVFASNMRGTDGVVSLTANDVWAHATAVTIASNIDVKVSTRSVFSAATDNVTIIDIDGIDSEQALARIMHGVTGNATISGNTVTMVRFDGSTSIGTVTMTATAGQRTGASSV